MSDTRQFYLQFIVDRGDDLTLLYQPVLEDSDTNSAFRHLFASFADPRGCVAYLDSEDFCLIVLRSSEFSSLRVFEYDEEAPYRGVYIDGRYVEAIGGTP